MRGGWTAQLDWRSAFLFYQQDPRWRSKLFLGGLFILLLPPAGWLLALGYRKEAAIRLVEGREPILPDWGARPLALLLGGGRAAIVILIYYIPFFALFWLLGVPDVETAQAHLSEIGGFFILLPLLVPICVLLLPPLYWWWFSWIELSGLEMFLIGALFWGTAFVLPAAFVRVSLTGRFRSALHCGKALAFIAAYPRLYLEAWLMSLLATTAGLLTVVLAPWGIFWSYLVIVFAFNDALVTSSLPEAVRRFEASKMLHPKRGEMRRPGG